MSRTQGELAGRTVWLVARYPQPPGQVIKLGSILTDPREPEESLNLESAEGIETPPNIRDASIAVRAYITSELTSNIHAVLKVAPPTNPIFNAAMALEGGKAKMAETVVDAMDVSAQTFRPSPDYMNTALANPDVLAYVKKGSFSKAVYIIVGVATAGTLKVRETFASSSAAEAAMGGSVGEGAVEFKAGLAGGRSVKSGIEREIENSCDFAYRAREFIYSKSILHSNRWVKGENVTSGTMFDTDHEAEEETLAVDLVGAEFDDFMSDDELPDEMCVFASQV